VPILPEIYPDFVQKRGKSRLFAGKIQLETHRTPAGKTFRLLNLPYYLSGRLKEYLDFFINNDSIYC
jgi:hypothetical protein